MDENIETFIVYGTFFSLGGKMSIYLAWEAQIVLLVVKKVTMPNKYSDFADDFFERVSHGALQTIKYQPVYHWLKT